MPPRRESLEALQQRRAASVSRSLMIFADGLRARVMREFVRRGFPAVDFPNAALFRNLDLHEGAPISTLARRAGVSRQAMQQLARRLERAGHVELVRDAADRRRLHVRFTPKGRAMIRASLRVYDRFDRAFGAALGPRALNQLRTALRTLSGTSKHGASSDVPRGRRG